MKPEENVCRLVGIVVRASAS